MITQQLLKTCNNAALLSLTCRQLSTSSVHFNKKWRLQNGYPKHWTERGILTDGADFSYEDGRPTPYTNGQRARLLTHKNNAEKILYLLEAVKFAKANYQEKRKAEEEEKQRILKRKLKPKGLGLLKN